MSKCPLSLIAKMLPALKEVAELSAFGNDTKYSPDSWLNWANQEEAEKFAKKRIDSFARHAMQGMEDIYSTDAETGMYHLSAAAWNALAIVTLIHEYNLDPLERYEDVDSIFESLKEGLEECIAHNDIELDPFEDPVPEVDLADTDIQKEFSNYKSLCAELKYKDKVRKAMTEFNNEHLKLNLNRKPL